MGLVLSLLLLCEMPFKYLNEVKKNPNMDAT
jgi:hypothetical protein